jgi:hypothetical protein
MICSALPTGLPPEEETKFHFSMVDALQINRYVSNLLESGAGWNFEYDNPQQSVRFMSKCHVKDAQEYTPINMLQAMMMVDTDQIVWPFVNLYALTLLRYKPYPHLVYMGVIHTVATFILISVLVNATAFVKRALSFRKQKVFFTDWIAQMSMLEYQTLELTQKKGATITQDNNTYVAGIRQAQQFWSDAQDFSAPDYAKSSFVNYTSMIRLLSVHNARLNYLLIYPDSITMPEEIANVKLTTPQALQLAIQKGTVTQTADPSAKITPSPQGLEHIWDNPPKTSPVRDKRDFIEMAYRMKLTQLQAAYGDRDATGQRTPIPWTNLDYRNLGPQAPMEYIPEMTKTQWRNYNELDPLQIAKDNLLMHASADLTTDEFHLYQVLLGLNPLNEEGSKIVLPSAFDPAYVDDPPMQNVVKRAVDDIVTTKSLNQTLILRAPVPALLPDEMMQSTANPQFNIQQGIPDWPLVDPGPGKYNYWDNSIPRWEYNDLYPELPPSAKRRRL